MEGPFKVHAVLAQLLFELSMKHVAFVQRKMRGPVSFPTTLDWRNDALTDSLRQLTIETLPNETTFNRAGSGQRTTMLQTLAKNANKLLADIESSTQNAQIM